MTDREATDLCRLLRALSAHEHSDHSIGTDAAEMIERQAQEIERLQQIIRYWEEIERLRGSAAKGGE